MIHCPSHTLFCQVGTKKCLVGFSFAFISDASVLSHVVLKTEICHKKTTNGTKISTGGGGGGVGAKLVKREA